MAFDQRAAFLHVRQDAVDALRKIRMNDEREDGNAETERRRDKRLADAARDG